MHSDQGPDGVDLTRAEAVAWIHYSTGAPVWIGCAEHDVLRQAAEIFWRDTRGTAKISSTPTTARHARAMSPISLIPMR
jgi:hypothetical protein